MKRSVIAFTGKRGSGKSLAASYLCDNLGYVDVKFAGPLKDMLRALYTTCGVDDVTIERKIEGDLKEVSCEWLNGRTPRYAMQTIGTEWREMIDTNLWSDIFIKRISGGAFGDKIVCSDYRFPHEADVLESVGAVTVRIKRPDADAATDEASKHASESLIDALPAQWEINNTGTIGDLYASVEAIVTGLADALERHG